MYKTHEHSNTTLLKEYDIILWAVASKPLPKFWLSINSEFHFNARNQCFHGTFSPKLVNEWPCALHFIWSGQPAGAWSLKCFIKYQWCSLLFLEMYLLFTNIFLCILTSQRQLCKMLVVKVAEKGNTQIQEYQPWHLHAALVSVYFTAAKQACFSSQTTIRKEGLPWKNK